MGLLLVSHFGRGIHACAWPWVLRPSAAVGLPPKTPLKEGGSGLDAFGAHQVLRGRVLGGLWEPALEGSQRAGAADPAAGHHAVPGVGQGEGAVFLFFSFFFFSGFFSFGQFFGFCSSFGQSPLFPFCFPPLRPAPGAGGGGLGVEPYDSQERAPAALAAKLVMSATTRRLGMGFGVALWDARFVQTWDLRPAVGKFKGLSFSPPTLAVNALAHVSM